MKAKKKEPSLRGRIMRNFILCCFGVAVIDSAVDSTFWDIIVPRLYPNDVGYRDYDLPHICYLGVTFLLFLLGALIFYRLTKKALKKESEKKVREQNLLYAAIAHDLKTPMTSVQGFAKALSDGKVPPEEQQEIFDIIYRKACSCDDMINTIFDYAKLGTSGYEPQLEQINLCTLVRDIAAENYCGLEAHSIGLELDIPDEEIAVKGDKKELRRAVTNLVVNIYKHSEDGIRAAITVKQENGRAVISIADSGKPIPEGMDIFEPFVTENSARTAGRGTGLGLAITKRIIERHGGTLTVENAGPDLTKAFVIRL